MTARVCTVDDCQAPHKARGLCNRHWLQFRKTSTFTRAFPEDGDTVAVCRFTGAADARNGRPRRVDIADTSLIGAAYTRGYDNPEAWRYE